jgi:hypothetical protein
MKSYEEVTVGRSRCCDETKIKQEADASSDDGESIIGDEERKATLLISGYAKECPMICT